MPKKPSLQAWTLDPSPSKNRPPLMRSMSMAAIAVSNGLRTNARAMPEASFTRCVKAAAAERGTKGGPYTCGAKSPSRPASSCILHCIASNGPGAGVTVPRIYVLRQPFVASLVGVRRRPSEVFSATGLASISTPHAAGANLAAMSDFVLALDQGTSSSRAILFDHSGRAVASSQQEFRQIYPQPGWVEHDADEIWDTQIAVARDVLKQAGIDAGNVSAIGITNQRETTVIWDRDGNPIANAIVWQDRRTAPACEALRAAGLEPKFRERTGLLLDPYFSGTKVKWLLDNVTGARKRAEAGELMFGTVDAWLLYRLTGVHATDYTNASRTLLYHIFERRWDEELLAALDVPASLLPP